jgi:hypothetical protein
VEQAQQYGLAHQETGMQPFFIGHKLTAPTHVIVPVTVTMKATATLSTILALAVPTAVLMNPEEVLIRQQQTLHKLKPGGLILIALF